jgi:hypothetical protein
MVVTEKRVAERQQLRFGVGVATKERRLPLPRPQRLPQQLKPAKPQGTEEERMSLLLKQQVRLSLPQRPKPAEVERVAEPKSLLPRLESLLESELSLSSKHSSSSNNFVEELALRLARAETNSMFSKNSLTTLQVPLQLLVDTSSRLVPHFQAQDSQSKSVEVRKMNARLWHQLKVLLQQLPLH